MMKLFIEEPGSDEVALAVQRAMRLVSSRLTYAEVRAGLAAAHRGHRIDDHEYEVVRAEFEGHWRRYFKVPATSQIVSSAGDLAEKHALAGMDALHLASAIAFRHRSPDIVDFSVFDSRLRSGAIAEGFAVV